MGFVSHHIIYTVSLSRIKQPKKTGVFVRYGLLPAWVWGVINATEEEEVEKKEESSSSTNQ